MVAGAQEPSQAGDRGLSEGAANRFGAQVLAALTLVPN